MYFRSRPSAASRRALRPHHHQLRRPKTLELLEGRVLLAADSAAAVAPWHNRWNARDVNVDHQVTANDAVCVVNDLLIGGARTLAPVAAPQAFDTTEFHYVDVTGDNELNARDVLAVANAVLANPLMSVYAHPLDLSGNPINSVNVGEEFLIAVDVQDTRDPVSATPGVFSACVDLLYDNGLVAIDAQVPEYGPLYQGVINEQIDVGTPGFIPGFLTISGLSPHVSNNVNRLWTIKAQASAAGVANFSPEFDDVLGHENLLYPGDVASESDVQFIGSQLTVFGTNPLVTISDAAESEGDSGITPFVFTVSLSAPTGTDVVVPYETADNTARWSESDYQRQSGTLTFLPGQTSKLITVEVNGDTVDEGDERFAVVIYPGSSVISGLGTILNDDNLELSVDDVCETEGNEGISEFIFKVTLSGVPGSPVTVAYETCAGSATAGVDYESTSGTLTFLPEGDLVQFVTVQVHGDTTYEADEKFWLKLSEAVGATIVDDKGKGKILNDDEPPTLSIDDVCDVEGDSETTGFVFKVSLSADSGLPVTVVYSTCAGSADEGSDYQSTSGTLSFLPGETVQFVTVLVNGDTTYEADETFWLKLTDAVGATISDEKGQGKIENDDNPPEVSIDDVEQFEGNEGPTNFVFTVRLSVPVGTEWVVEYYTANNTAKASDNDYVPINDAAFVTFAPGDTEKQITVVVNGDTKVEPDEKFAVMVLANNADSLMIAGLGTILNDDGQTQPAISISDVSLAEGNAGPTNFVFTVSLNAPSASPVTVAYQTADGSASSASDYGASNGTITFAAGTTSQVLTLQVNGDTLFELDETFQVNLSAPSGATIADVSGLGVIQNDDQQPAITVNDVTLLEGNAGTTPFVFTVSLAQAAGAEVTVYYYTADNTATTANSDYQPISILPLFFSPGELAKQVTVFVNGDTAVEANEKFALVLNTAQGLITGLGNIQNDDDVSASLAITPAVSVPEGDAGQASLLFTVSRTGFTGSTVTVEFQTQDSTAQAGSDYTASSGTLTFNVGETTKIVTVNATGDTAFEGNESFLLNLSNPSGASISGAVGQGTIENDDSPPQVSVTDASGAEGNNGNTAFVFTVSLAAATGAPVLVPFVASDNTATVANADFAPTSGTLTFLPGETLKLVTVQVQGDTTPEANEKFALVLSTASGLISGVGNISDDDQIVIAATGTVTLNGTEGNDRFVVKLDDNVPNAVLVLINDVPFGPYDLASLTLLVLNGLAGDDSLVVDSTNGLVAIDQGTQFDGGLGFDRVSLTQTGDSPAQRKSRYHVGPVVGSGVSEIEDVGPVIQKVAFSNVEPSYSPPPIITVNALSAPEASTFADPGTSLTPSALVSGPTATPQAVPVFTEVIQVGTAGDDVFQVQVDPTDASKILVSLNGFVYGAIDRSLLSKVTLSGLSGNDTLVVDSTYGLISIPEGIEFDGGSGFDSVKLQQDGGVQHKSSRYRVGPAVGSGSSEIVGQDGAVQRVDFANIEPFFDPIPAVDVFVFGTDADNAINYSQGIVAANGLVTVDEHESLEFTNKDNLIIEAMNGSDTINLDNPSIPVGFTPGGLKTIQVRGSDPTGSDTLVVNAVQGVADMLIVQPTAQGIGSITSTAPYPSMSFTGIEHLKLEGQMNEGDTFAVNGTAGNDAFMYNVGAAPDSGTVNGVMNQTVAVFPLVPITFGNMSMAVRQFNTINPAGDDRFLYTATGAKENLVVSQSASGISIGDFINQVGFGVVTAANMVSVQVDSAGGNDTVNYNILAEVEDETSVVLEGGESDNTSDSLIFNADVSDVIFLNLEDRIISTTSSLPVTFGGFEKVTLVAQGIASALNVLGTAVDDEFTYTPTGTLSGNFSLTGLNVAFNFVDVSGPFTVNTDAGNDVVNVRGTSARDSIQINAVARTAQVNSTKAVTLSNPVESLTALGLAGDDTFNVVPAAGVGGSLDNLLINIDGGDPQASDALVVSGPGGANLAADQFVVLNRSASPGAGTVRVFTAAVQWPDITYKDVEIVSPRVSGGGFTPNLLVLGPDPYEPNEFLGTATFLGSGSNLQIQHASIFPNDREHDGVPADEDFYRVVATYTGTLDFQVYFRLFSDDLLPGGGELGIQVIDSNGNVIGAAGAVPAPIFGASNDNLSNSGTRVRIPAVAGQTYFLRVFGEVIDERTSVAVNGYDATIINTPAPVPFNLALSRSVAPPAAGSPGTGDLPTDAVASDTGRSQFDNVTREVRPTIYIRLADGILLNDLPGNGTPGPSPIGTIPIPFDGADDTPAAGFRIAIFDGNNSQTPVGFATAVDPVLFPGLYVYTFTADLAEGLHHINAAVQIIDPRTGTPVTGFGALSLHSLDLIIDPTPPPVFFGSAAAPFDGLAAGSDTGVPNTPSTFVDRITADTAPTFYGTAEANSIIRMYVRVIGPEVIVEIPIGLTVAIPLDGTNAYPGGSWTLKSTVDLNALPDPFNPGQLLPRDGVRQIVITAEDLAGNVSDRQLLDIFIDTQGPTIASVSITGLNFDLFGLKTVDAPPHSPTPLINSLTIDVEDLPVEDANFLRNAIATGVIDVPGLIVLRGDHNGVIPIQSVTVVPQNPQTVGDPARDQIIITFASALPDDRYTLIVSDQLVDPAGNHLDGENTASEPQPPNFNTGNGINGGNFVARFTVDSRPEIGVYAGQSVLADINGNGYWDPAAPEITNRDLPFLFGEISDQRFAGKLSPTQLPGFDVLAAYGNYNGQFRFLIDLNGNGAVDTGETFSLPGNLQINGIAVAGNFDGNSANGDEIALFTGNTFYIFSNDLGSASQVGTSLRGYPLAGDFDGDGVEDLATYQNDVFYFDFGFDGFGSVGDTINFGAPGVTDRPVAADMDGDTIDDIGIWIPHSGTEQNTPEWRFLISNNFNPRNEFAPVAGSVAFLKHPFSPVPLGSDIGFHFGDPTALPIVGNFDPPPNLQAPSTNNGGGNNSGGSGSNGGSNSGGGSTPAPAASGDAAHARSLVASLYHDILGRAPDAGGWDFFSQQIASGASRGWVAHALLTSAEYCGHVVDRLYATYLHRTADVQGRADWVNKLVSGASEDFVAAGLILSVEYAQMHSGNAAFVEALYQDVLGRSSDVTGRSNFLFALGTGGSRHEVASALLTSQERIGQVVDQAYLEMFGRHAEQAGLQHWSSKIRGGQLTARSLKEALVATDEYFQRSIQP